MTARPSLAELQLRFHAACTGAAPLDSAAELVRADGIEPVSRLHVYAHAYVARIAGVLAKDFPKLRALLGDERFDELVVPYLRAHPPRHPSLREAGARLAEFLAASGDALAADLARLERARIEAFDGADAAPLTRDELASVDPAAFPSLALRLVPTAMLVDLATNADDVWDAIEDGRDPPPRADAARTVAVWRRDITVIHRTLEPDEAAALRVLAGGASFADICEVLAATATGDVVERALELLLRWLDAELVRS